MLRYLLLIVFFISFRLCSYEQKDSIKGGGDELDIINPTPIKVRFGDITYTGTILVDTTPIHKNDSTHYFFTQYIRLKNKGVPDSINHWFYKLNNKK